MRRPSERSDEGRTRRRSFRERGQTLVEFSIVSLVFFVLVFGVFDMARLFQSWMTVQHAARESARYGITGRDTCTGTSGRNACIVWTAKNATTGLENGGPSASDANVTVTYKAWDYHGSTWTGPTSNATGKACDQVEVTVVYRHHFATPIMQVFAPSGIPLQGVQRMTNEPFGTCNSSGDGVS